MKMNDNLRGGARNMRRRQHGRNSGPCRVMAAVHRCKEVLPAFKVIPSG